MRILVVDDNETHLYALQRILEHAGHQVFTANTGTQTLELANREVPDVVLLDINLPDINGYEICSRLKSDEHTRGLAVVFHTATHATAIARNHAESVGASAFLTY